MEHITTRTSTRSCRASTRGSWRKKRANGGIYKALTLLEFLVKNGSERVVDDARAHVSTVKMLRSFHYIDEKGKDQGINVRNRASEIALLLGDVDKIRQERRKAKANKNKYQGTGNDGGMSFVTAGGSRYGGFGSDSLGGGGGGGGGSGAGYNGGADDYRGSRTSASWNRGDQNGDNGFDEYEGADDFDEPPRRGTPSGSGACQPSSRPQPPPKGTPRKAAAAPAIESKPAPKPKEVNLFDFGDDEDVSGPTSAPSASQQPILGGDDDDFDDFQTAPSATPAQASAPPPAAPKQANAGLFDMLNSSVPSAAANNARPQSASTSSGSFGFAASGAAPNYVSPISAQTPAGMPAMTSRPSYTSGGGATSGMTSPSATSATAASKKPGSAFDDLFSSSLSTMSSGGGAGGNKAASSSAGMAGAGGKKTIKEMEQEKAMASLWGAPQSPQAGAQRAQGQSAAAKQAQAAGGFDDLLL